MRGGIINILFLTIGRFESIEAHSIYADLLRCFRNHGHTIYVISPNERRTGKKTELIHEKGARILHVETDNVTGASSLIRKGIAQISIESIYINAIERYFPDVQFDLVMYSTPPITFCRVVEYLKKRDCAHTYLLLKDIFPQNAVDLEMMTKNGIRGLIYKYFRSKEKRLYLLSDYIGCISEANIEYVIYHNPDINPAKVELCPNAIEISDKSVDVEMKKEIRIEYGIPIDKTVFVYGGNLGKPQGIQHVIECMRRVKNLKDAYFLIVGSGSDYVKLENYVKEAQPDNIKLLNLLPKEEYDDMVGACDVGMIFLDHRFTIPNFPSRLLAYMQAKLPVLACTDPNTDIGKVISENGFGWWCESNDAAKFKEIVEDIIEIPATDINDMGETAFEELKRRYDVQKCYEQIIHHF